MPADLVFLLKELESGTGNKCLVVRQENSNESFSLKQTLFFSEEY
jgi:hypothetical protein